MKKRIYPLICTLLALTWMSSVQATETPDANKPSEQHIYLHVVAPEGDGNVKLFLQPFIEEGPADEVVDAQPEPIPTEATPARTDTPDEPMEEEAVPEPAPITAEPATPLPASSSTTVADKTSSMGLLFFTFVLAIFLGFELISKVPSQLHTPLMSGSNAISGITIVGALAVAGMDTGSGLSTLLGTLAVAFATINVVGGYLVTNRMLGMFKKKDGGPR